MNRHNHHDCTHSIKLCKDCDTVYCEGCNKEWTTKTIVWDPWTTISSGTTYQFPSNHSDHIV